MNPSRNKSIPIDSEKKQLRKEIEELKLNVQALEEAKKNSEKEVADAMEVISLKEIELSNWQKSYEEKSKAAQLELEKVRKAQEERGLFTGLSGPYDFIPSLRNVSDDAYENGILIFRLSQGKSDVGSSNASTLQLRGIPSEFCIFKSSVCGSLATTFSVECDKDKLDLVSKVMAMACKEMGAEVILKNDKIILKTHAQDVVANLKKQ